MGILTTASMKARKNPNMALSILGMVIIFAAGWYGGRETAPYTNAQPIVFEDTECLTSNESVEELKKLVEEKPEPEQGSTPSPAVAGAVTTTNPTGGVTAQKFVGSINSNLFHDPTCSSASRIKPENQIWFASIEDANRAGYSASKCTQDKLGI